MVIEKNIQEETLTLKLKGNLTAATAPPVQSLVDEIAPEIRKLVFALEELDYVASAGIRVLVSAQKQMKTRGGSMTLRGVKPSVGEVLTMTGLNRVFTME